VKTIQDLKSDAILSDAKSANDTIFHAILRSDLPTSAKTDNRLEHEAQVVIGAGIVTTAWAATQAGFFILSNHQVHSRLLEELREAIPDVTATEAFGYDKLERLQYLGGCVREGVRFSFGISGRNTRVLQEPLEYKDYTIPAGTVISMSFRDVNFDESVFEDPKAYKPERWFPGAAKAADGASLESHFVGFGKGPRSCLGTKCVLPKIAVSL
jgi:cytochrome P450